MRSHSSSALISIYNSNEQGDLHTLGSSQQLSSKIDKIHLQDYSLGRGSPGGDFNSSLNSKFSGVNHRESLGDQFSGDFEPESTYGQEDYPAPYFPYRGVCEEDGEHMDRLSGQERRRGAQNPQKRSKIPKIQIPSNPEFSASKRFYGDEYHTGASHSTHKVHKKRQRRRDIHKGMKIVINRLLDVITAKLDHKLRNLEVLIEDNIANLSKVKQNFKTVKKKLKLEATPNADMELFNCDRRFFSRMFDSRGVRGSIEYAPARSKSRKKPFGRRKSVSGIGAVRAQDKENYRSNCARGEQGYHSRGVERHEYPENSLKGEKRRKGGRRGQRPSKPSRARVGGYSKSRARMKRGEGSVDGYEGLEGDFGPRRAKNRKSVKKVLKTAKRSRSRTNASGAGKTGVKSRFMGRNQGRSKSRQNSHSKSFKQKGARRGDQEGYDDYNYSPRTSQSKYRRQNHPKRRKGPKNGKTAKNEKRRVFRARRSRQGSRYPSSERDYASGDASEYSGSEEYSESQYSDYDSNIPKIRKMSQFRDKELVLSRSSVENILAGLDEPTERFENENYPRNRKSRKTGKMRKCSSTAVFPNIHSHLKNHLGHPNHTPGSRSTLKTTKKQKHQKPKKHKNRSKNHPKIHREHQRRHNRHHHAHQTLHRHQSETSTLLTQYQTQCSPSPDLAEVGVVKQHPKKKIKSQLLRELSSKQKLRKLNQTQKHKFGLCKKKVQKDRMVRRMSLTQGSGTLNDFRFVTEYSNEFDFGAGLYQTQQVGIKRNGLVVPRLELKEKGSSDSGLSYGSVTPKNSVSRSGSYVSENEDLGDFEAFEGEDEAFYGGNDPNKFTGGVGRRGRGLGGRGKGCDRGDSSFEILVRNAAQKLSEIYKTDASDTEQQLATHMDTEMTEIGQTQTTENYDQYVDQGHYPEHMMHQEAQMLTQTETSDLNHPKMLETENSTENQLYGSGAETEDLSEYSGYSQPQHVQPHPRHLIHHPQIYQNRQEPVLSTLTTTQQLQTLESQQPYKLMDAALKKHTRTLENPENDELASLAGYWANNTLEPKNHSKQISGSPKPLLRCKRRPGQPPVELTISQMVRMKESHEQRKRIRKQAFERKIAQERDFKVDKYLRSLDYDSTVTEGDLKGLETQMFDTNNFGEVMATTSINGDFGAFGGFNEAQRVVGGSRGVRRGGLEARNASFKKKGVKILDVCSSGNFGPGAVERLNQQTTTQTTIHSTNKTAFKTNYSHGLPKAPQSRLFTFLKKVDDLTSMALQGHSPELTTDINELRPAPKRAERLQIPESQDQDFRDFGSFNTSTDHSQPLRGYKSTINNTSASSKPPNNPKNRQKAKSPQRQNQAYEDGSERPINHYLADQMFMTQTQDQGCSGDPKIVKTHQNLAFQSNLGEFSRTDKPGLYKASTLTANILRSKGTFLSNDFTQTITGTISNTIFGTNKSCEYLYSKDDDSVGSECKVGVVGAGANARKAQNDPNGGYKVSASFKANRAIGGHRQGHGVVKNCKNWNVVVPAEKSLREQSLKASDKSRRISPKFYVTDDDSDADVANGGRDGQQSALNASEYPHLGQFGGNGFTKNSADSAGFEGSSEYQGPNELNLGANSLQEGGSLALNTNETRELLRQEINPLASPNTVSKDIQQTTEGTSVESLRLPQNYPQNGQKLENGQNGHPNLFFGDKSPNSNGDPSQRAFKGGNHGDDGASSEKNSYRIVQIQNRVQDFESISEEVAFDVRLGRPKRADRYVKHPQISPEKRKLNKNQENYFLKKRGAVAEIGQNGADPEPQSNSESTINAQTKQLPSNYVPKTQKSENPEKPAKSLIPLPGKRSHSAAVIPSMKPPKATSIRPRRPFQTRKDSLESQGAFKDSIGLEVMNQAVSGYNSNSTERVLADYTGEEYHNPRINSETDSRRSLLKISIGAGSESQRPIPGQNLEVEGLRGVPEVYDTAEDYVSSEEVPESSRMAESSRRGEEVSPCMQKLDMDLADPIYQQFYGGGGTYSDGNASSQKIGSISGKSGNSPQEGTMAGNGHREPHGRYRESESSLNGAGNAQNRYNMVSTVRESSAREDGSGVVGGLDSGSEYVGGGESSDGSHRITPFTMRDEVSGTEAGGRNHGVCEELKNVVLSQRPQEGLDHSQDHPNHPENHSGQNMDLLNRRRENLLKFDQNPKNEHNRGQGHQKRLVNNQRSLSHAHSRPNSLAGLGKMESIQEEVEEEILPYQEEDEENYDYSQYGDPRNGYNQADYASGKNRPKIQNYGSRNPSESRNGANMADSKYRDTPNYNQGIEEDSDLLSPDYDRIYLQSAGGSLEDLQRGNVDHQDPHESQIIENEPNIQKTQNFDFSEEKSQKVNTEDPLDSINPLEPATPSSHASEQHPPLTAQSGDRQQHPIPETLKNVFSGLQTAPEIVKFSNRLPFEQPDAAERVEIHNKMQDLEVEELVTLESDSTEQSGAPPKPKKSNARPEKLEMFKSLMRRAKENQELGVDIDRVIEEMMPGSGEEGPGSVYESEYATETRDGTGVGSFDPNEMTTVGFGGSGGSGSRVTSGWAQEGNGAQEGATSGRLVRSHLETQ